MNRVHSVLLACVLLLIAAVSLADNETNGTGTVVETLASGGYVYVRLQEDNRWLAARPVAVSVGDEVSYAGGSLMTNFHSPTLNRDFEAILFVSQLTVSKPASADGHAARARNDSHSVIPASAVADEPQAGEIAPLDGGKTIADIYGQVERLDGQKVRLRAKVMKVSAHILGKTWVTLRDGTANAAGNQLIATSVDDVDVTVGELVTASGVIHTNVDLGSGYNYPVLLEETIFSH